MGASCSCQSTVPRLIPQTESPTKEEKKKQSDFGDVDIIPTRGNKRPKKHIHVRSQSVSNDASISVSNITSHQQTDVNTALLCAPNNINNHIVNNNNGTTTPTAFVNFGAPTPTMPAIQRFQSADHAGQPSQMTAQTTQTTQPVQTSCITPNPPRMVSVPLQPNVVPIRPISPNFQPQIQLPHSIQNNNNINGQKLSSPSHKSYASHHSIQSHTSDQSQIFTMGPPTQTTTTISSNIPKIPPLQTGNVVQHTRHGSHGSPVSLGSQQGYLVPMQINNNQMNNPMINQPIPYGQMLHISQLSQISHSSAGSVASGAGQSGVFYIVPAEAINGLQGRNDISRVGSLRTASGLNVFGNDLNSHRWSGSSAGIGAGGMDINAFGNNNNNHNSGKIKSFSNANSPEAMMDRFVTLAGQLSQMNLLEQAQAQAKAGNIVQSNSQGAQKKVSSSSSSQQRKRSSSAQVRCQSARFGGRNKNGNGNNNSNQKGRQRVQSTHGTPKLFRYDSSHRWTDETVNNELTNMADYFDKMRKHNSLQQRHKEQGYLTSDDEQEFFQLKLQLNAMAQSLRKSDQSGDDTTDIDKDKDNHKDNKTNDNNSDNKKDTPDKETETVVKEDEEIDEMDVNDEERRQGGSIIINDLSHLNGIQANANTKNEKEDIPPVPKKSVSFVKSVEKDLRMVEEMRSSRGNSMDFDIDQNDQNNIDIGPKLPIMARDSVDRDDINKVSDAQMLDYNTDSGSDM